MFEQDAADAGFFDVRAGNDDAVIAQEDDLCSPNSLATAMPCSAVTIKSEDSSNLSMAGG